MTINQPEMYKYINVLFSQNYIKTFLTSELTFWWSWSEIDLTDDLAFGKSDIFSCLTSRLTFWTWSEIDLEDDLEFVTNDIFYYLTLKLTFWP